MRRFVMNRGVIGILSVVLALCFVTLGWGAELMKVSLVDLSDRDAVILEVDGTALVSDLVVHKLRPNRLEAYFQYQGEPAAVPVVNSDLITAVEITERPEGFLMTLSLADRLSNSVQTVYRETVLDGGRTVIEVFAPDSGRSPFQASWLEPADAAVEALSPPPAVTPAPGLAGVEFNPASGELVLRGAAKTQYEITRQNFPARVDVALSGPSSPDLLGLVHKDLGGGVTYVEVIESPATGGMTVRASMAPDTTLENQELRGNDLVLRFGKSASQLSVPSPAPKPRSFADAPDSPAPAGTPPAAEPLGATLSSAAAQLAPEQMGGGMGFRGVTQDVPSVEAILAKAKEDAYRYGESAASKGDAYGSYELPGFEGEEELLSDVRVNLNAAGGFDLYQFLMFLSSLSGISIIIDPYWLDEPFGTTRRDPPEVGELPGGGGGAGFRSAGLFDPQLGASGSVMGNFDNVPFDQALDIVLNTHNLRKVVYRDEENPYAKPIILITSQERLEQEIKGQNEIDLYQLHYADPFQLYQILYMLNLLPSLTVGWYYYQGGGYGGGQGTGGRGTGGGGSGGGRGGTGGGNRGGGRTGGFSAEGPSIAETVSVNAEVRDNYFDPLAFGVEPYQGGGGIGGGGFGGQAGGGGTGGGAGGGGIGGGTGGGGGGFGGQLWTAKAGLVVMRGTRETLNTVQALIAKIDKPPKQVALKVKLYTVSDDPQNVYGLIRATAQDDRIESSYQAGALTLNVLQKGGVLLDENYSAAFTFLQTERKATLVSETEVAVIDGFPASISTSVTRAHLNYQVSAVTNDRVIYAPTWDPVTAGTTLDFTPQVDDRGRITMFVDINISFFDGPAQRAAAPDGGEVVFQPTGNTDIQTYLRMVDGQAALIGGLTNSEDSTTFEGIPFISKLPIIGQFFGRTEKVKTSNHFFVVIQANIIDDK